MSFKNFFHDILLCIQPSSKATVITILDKAREVCVPIKAPGKKGAAGGKGGAGAAQAAKSAAIAAAAASAAVETSKEPSSKTASGGGDKKEEKPAKKKVCSYQVSDCFSNFSRPNVT